METIKKISPRKILIFGIVAAALYLFAGIYSPYNSMYQSGSILSPSLVTVIIILPLVLFFAAVWLRANVPALFRTGALVGAVSGVAVIPLQIYYYSVWVDVLLSPDGFSLIGKMRAARLLLGIADTALYVGILLIGVSLLRGSGPKIFKAGLGNVVGGALGMFSFAFSVVRMFLPVGTASESDGVITTLLALAARVPLLVLLYFLYQDQKGPESKPGRRLSRH